MVRDVFIGIGTFVVLCGRLVFAAEPLAVIGAIPGEYLGKTATRSHLGYVLIRDRLIEAIEPIESETALKALVSELEDEGVRVIVAKRARARKYDVLYPGLIDLHGHNKQNMLPTWESARGQFANRHEWRDRPRVPNYPQVQTDNMSPWSSAREATAACYRWSELQAMVLGTTYLQGAIQYHVDFAIHSVEDNRAYITEKAGISSPGDLVDKDRSQFLWNEIRPVIRRLGCLDQEGCYGKAVVKYLESHCDGLPAAVTRDAYDEESYKWLLENAEKLGRSCKFDDAETKKAFLEYFTDVFGTDQHSEFIKKTNALRQSNRSAVITHLAEGSRLDPYNWTEFQILRLAGLARPGMSFIHGVGLQKRDFEHMARNEMGLVWSPYSNHLLYGETVDIATAKAAGVTIALGSDWTPTGSKGVLDELKLARNYVLKEGLSRRAFSDRELYYMVTKYPAQIIGHYGYEADGEHGIGTLEPGAMGTLIAVEEKVLDPYTNLVAKAGPEEVSLVVVDGEPQYGSRSYLEPLGEELEVISNRLFAHTLKKNPGSFPPPGSGPTEVGKKAAAIPLQKGGACKFNEERVLVLKESGDFDRLQPFIAKTKSGGHAGLNLDTYSGIVRYLGVALLSQSRNAATGSEWAVKEFPPLYGCDDPGYSSRLKNMVKENGGDEADANRENRGHLRIEMRLYSYDTRITLPEELAHAYHLPYLSEEWELEEEGATKDIVVDVSLDVRSDAFEKLLAELGGR